MLTHKEKALEDMDFNECLEFEKFMLKKILAASRSQMSDGIVDQLNVFLDIIRERKKAAMLLKSDGNNDGVSVWLGEEPPVEDEDEQELPDDN